MTEIESLEFSEAVPPYLVTVSGINHIGKPIRTLKMDMTGFVPGNRDNLFHYDNGDTVDHEKAGLCDLDGSTGSVFLPGEDTFL